MVQTSESTRQKWHQELGEKFNVRQSGSSSLLKWDKKGQKYKQVWKEVGI